MPRTAGRAMPEHVSIQQLLTDATAKYHTGDYRQAIQIWQKILLSEPGNQKAKEGIRMASLLLEEAQAAAAVGQGDAAAPGETSESQESIAKVREGIQTVRNHLAASNHLAAMEVCQSLLALAPRSAAVHEIVEEAREAYEAQPFIHEHLVIAQQLFVQERLAEASAELHKIFFLNPNHGEARKLEAKILALKQKMAPSAHQAAPAAPETEAALPVTTSAAPDPAETRRFTAPPDFGDSLDLPAEAPPVLPAAPEPAAASPAAPAASEGTAPPSSSDAAGKTEDWEAELAQLTLGGPSAAPAVEAPTTTGGTPEPPAEEKLEILGLSEGPGAPAPKAPEPPAAPALTPETAAAEAPAPAAPPTVEPEAPTRGEVPPRKTADDLDLSALMDDQEEAAPAPSPVEEEAGEEKIPAKRPPVREAPVRVPSRSGASVMKYVLPLAGIVIGGGAAWWFFGAHSSNSGNGGNPPPPPSAQARQNAPGPVVRRGSGSGANLGLSSSGSKPSGNTASAGVSLPAPGSAPLPPAPAPPLSPEQTRQEIARLSGEGRAFMGRGKYQEAVKSFSRILDLDPANMEAKDQMDQAASKILEQRRLEEDLQTAKEFFVEKDYESALRKFYRLPKDRNLGELDLFIRNAWYNWAVVSMKGGNCVEALQRLQETLTLDPSDEEALRSQEVAQHYKDRPKDRVFYAYADRLTYRTLNQR